MDPNTYEQSIRRNYRFNYWVLFVDTFAFTVITKVLSPSINLTYWLSQYTTAETIIGLIPMIGLTGSMISQFFFANWVNGLKHKKPAFIAATVISRGSMVLFLLTTAIFGHSKSSVLPVVMFFVSYGTYSLANGLVSPLWSNFVAQSIPERRGKFLGTAYFIDGVLGVAGAFGIRQILNSRPFPDNFVWVFAILSAFAIVTILPAILYKETPYPGERNRQSIAEYFRQLPRMLRENPLYAKLLAVRMLICFAEMSGSFFTVYAMKRLAAGTADIGIYSIVMIAAGMIANLVWGWTGDKLGWKFVFQSAMVIGFTQVTLALLARNAASMYLVFFLFGAYGNAIGICIMNLNLEVSPATETPLFLGTANAMTGPFLAFAPQLGALLAIHFSYKVLFMVCMAIYVIDFSLLTFGVRMPKRHALGSVEAPVSPASAAD
jgi:MFS family permease